MRFFLQLSLLETPQSLCQQLSRSVQIIKTGDADARASWAWLEVRARVKTVRELLWLVGIRSEIRKVLVLSSDEAPEVLARQLELF